MNKYNLIWTKMTKVMAADLIDCENGSNMLTSFESVWLLKEPE